MDVLFEVLSFLFSSVLCYSLVCLGDWMFCVYNMTICLGNRYQDCVIIFQYMPLIIHHVNLFLEHELI